ncbi:MAG TPA: FecR family protein [Candidatus Binataceae bacterium]|nr:FecR family protein [Candidatus Binataceae bacterium]
MRRTVQFLLVAALLARAGLAWGANADQNPIGSVTAVTGIVGLERKGHESNVAPSSAVFVGDVYTTKPSSTLIIRLLGGTELDVGQSTSIVMDQDTLVSATRAQLTIIKLLGGKLHSFVNALATGGQFFVRTDNAICGVRGTEFETAYIVGRPCPDAPTCLRYTDVAVYKGTVEVTNPTNPQRASVMVGKGQETAVPCELAPTSPSPLGMRELGTLYH